MKKKSLLFLFTCLVISGLLQVWSVDAMTYIVQWTTTQIAIPYTQRWSKIKRCSGCEEETLTDGNPSSQTSCQQKNEWGWFEALFCTHDYLGNEWPHSVTFSGYNNISFDNLSLNSWNISEIKNFNNIWWINNIYMQYNAITGFNLSLLSNINPSLIDLSHNEISQINGSLPGTTRSLLLNNNQLTTIPEKIWNERWNYSIILDGGITIWDNQKYVDLRNNPINFLWITKIWEKDSKYCNNRDDCWFTDTTGYNFERFGYANGTTNLSYQYEIIYQYNTIKSGTVLNSTWINIDDTPLKPGPYTFKISLEDNPDINKSIDFIVSYDEGIEITSPANQEQYTSLDNILWQRKRYWNYPQEFVSWYVYTINKWSQQITWSISLDETQNCNNIWSSQYDYKNCITIDIWNIITNLIWWENPNGTYELTVYLVDKDNNPIETFYSYYSSYHSSYNWHEVSATGTFTVAIPDDPATLSITSPIGNVSTPTTTFSWDHSLPTWNTFLNYTYSVKQWTNTIKTGKFTSEATNSFTLTGLTDGSYTFSITMNYSGHSWTTWINASSVFTMTAGNGKYLNITSPTSWQKFSPTWAKVARINFKWNWWGSSLISGYYYTVTSWNSIIHSWYINKNNSWSYVTWWNLSNWTYTFNVQMLNNEGNIMKTGSVHFYVDIPSTLTISTPTIQLNSASINRNWFTPYEFLKYTYKLSGSTLTNPITWESNNETWDSIEYTDLRDGTYTFSIDMLYRIWSTTWYVTGTKVFTINSNSGAYLNITSPISWSQTTRNVQFSWNGWNAPSFKQYSYEIKSWTNIIYSWYTTWTSFTRALSDWTYTFTVKMLDNGWNVINSLVKSSRFTVRAAVSLEILSPTSWLQNSNTIDFIWSWDAETFGYFDYTVSKVNWLPVAIKYGTWDINFRSFTISNLHHGVYQFTVKIKSTSNTILATQTRPFYILDDLDLILNISSDNASIPASWTIRSRTGTFSWDWKSEDLSGFYYSVEGTTFSWDSYIYTWIQFWTSWWNFTLTGLQSGKYRFTVRMLDTDSWVITWKTMDFNVQIPARLKITSPTSWSTITSSSYTFNWTWYSDIISWYEYKLTKSGDTQTWTNTFTTNNSFSTNLSNWEYTLNVRISSWWQLVAHDSTNFTVAIKKSSGGWGGWSSSNSHRTNDLSVSITNKEPTTNEWVEVIVDINDKYSWKVDFTKMQYYSPDEEKRIDIPVTSKNYVSDYSDDAKLWYVKFDSNDDGEKQLSQFLKFSENGNYRIYVQDKDWYRDYVQFYVWKWNKAQLTSTPTKESNDDEYYIARSCKKYKLEYIDSLGVRTSPNLKINEYFINKDYFKRYIDSKNKQIDGCPTNVWWISTTYSDKSNSSKQYAAPNGKVYFISQENGSYSSKELNKELNGTKNFSSINNLKYFIRDRNHFLNMTLPVK